MEIALLLTQQREMPNRGRGTTTRSVASGPQRESTKFTKPGQCRNPLQWLSTLPVLGALRMASMSLRRYLRGTRDPWLNPSWCSHFALPK